MATVCQKCGVRGFAELLIFCNQCKIFAEHRYCLDVIPEDSEIKVNLLCEQCSKQGSTVVSFDTLNRSGCKKKNLCSVDKKPKEAESNALSSQKNTSLKELAKVKKNCDLSSQTQKLKRRKRRLILSDDEMSDDEAQFDGIACNALLKNTLKPNELSKVVAPRLKTRVSGPELKRVQCSSGSDEDINGTRQRRRLILPDEDGLEDQVLPNGLDHKILNKSTLPLPPSEGAWDIGIAVRRNAIVSTELVRRSQVVSAVATEPQKVVQADACEAQSSRPCDQTYEQSIYTPARPIFYHAWRGCFEICNEEYGPVVAHISSRACEKVFYGAKMLTPVLHLEKLSRLDAWPNSFKTSPPTDDNIALYFFPSDGWSEALFYQLIDDIISRDLMLKVTFDEAELLLYASVLLPEYYHRFNGKYYLWAVFRRRHAPISSSSSELIQLMEDKPVPSPSTPASCCSRSSGLPEKQVPVPSTPVKCRSKWNPHNPMEEEQGSRDMKHEEVMTPYDKQFLQAALNGDAGALPPSLDSLQRQETSAPNILANSCSKLRELADEKQKMLSPEHSEDREDGAIYDEVSLDASLCANDDTGKEREEPDICEEGPVPVLANRHVADGTVSCLELFPLQNENMAIEGRVGGSNGLDLELGLGRFIGDADTIFDHKARPKFLSLVYADSTVY